MTLPHALSSELQELPGLQGGLSDHRGVLWQHLSDKRSLKEGTAQIRSSLDAYTGKGFILLVAEHMQDVPLTRDCSVWSSGIGGQSESSALGERSQGVNE